MKLPRLTIRRLMLIVVLAALVLTGLGLLSRSEQLLEKSHEHIGPAAEDGTVVITSEGPAYTNLRTEKGRWHEAMRRKYDYY